MARSSVRLVVVVFVACILLSGGRADAAISPRAAASAPQFFSTQWPNFPQVLVANSNVDVPFVVGANDALDTTQDSPTLALLWTTTTSGLKSSNTWDVVNVTYSCSSDDDGNCSFDPGSNGTANLAVAANPSELSDATAIVPGKFLLCFANAVNASTHAFTCESYSPFFDIVLPQVESSGTATSASVSTTIITVSLHTPTGVLSITRSTKILTSLSFTIGPLSTTSAPDSATITATVSSSVSATSHQTPIIPTASLLPVTGTYTSHKRLSAGAKAGIAVSVILIVLIAVIIAFFFCQRRRPATRTTQNHNLAPVMGEEIPRELVDKSPVDGVSYTLSSDNTKESLRQPPSAATALPVLAPNPAMLALTPPASRGASRGPSRDRSSTSRSPSPGFSAEELSAAEELDYHDDTPRYGDARHVPLVFQRARFLGEPGMNAQQMAALEEEERRIDAAIAERERRRKR